MGLLAATLLASALVAAPGERVLICRPTVGGEPALARTEAFLAAVRDGGDRLLDYGVHCESVAEAARAAQRAGLTHAVFAVAEGDDEGSRYALSVVDAGERLVAVRRVDGPPGEALTRAIRGALAALVAEVPRPERERSLRRRAWGVTGVGAGLVAVGVLLSGAARAEADRANSAPSPEAYLAARSGWTRSRGWSGAALGIGGAALAAGIAWRIDLGWGD